MKLIWNDQNLPSYGCHVKNNSLIEFHIFSISFTWLIMQKLIFYIPFRTKIIGVIQVKHMKWNINKIFVSLYILDVQKIFYEVIICFLSNTCCYKNWILTVKNKQKNENVLYLFIFGLFYMYYIKINWWW